MRKILLSLLMLGAVTATRAQDAYRRPALTEDRLYATRVLSDADFKVLQRSINKEPFSDDKKRVFRLGIQNTYITVDQLQALIKPIAFDDDKIDWLFAAYPRTADIQQFYRLRASLTFESSRDRFDKTLAGMTVNDRPRSRRLQVMDQQEFAQLKDQISKEAFADGRKNVFKLGLQFQMITVAQLAQVMKLLTFDDEKLAIAKMAFDRTADIQRFYTLRDQLTFDSSKQQLDKFLLQNKS